MQPSSPQSEPGQFTSAPPVQLPPDPGAQPVDTALRRVILLMFINLGLSVVTTVVTLLLHTSVLNYQFAHARIPANATPAQIDAIHQALQTALWSKLVATVLVAALYIWRAYALRRGSRGAYLRLYYICVAGIIGIGYLILAGQYPIWMRVEQGLQAVVLIALLIAVSRKEVRYRFAKQRLA
jgi:magnesium-transporting ATPase (P-type)